MCPLRIEITTNEVRQFGYNVYWGNIEQNNASVAIRFVTKTMYHISLVV